MVGRGLNFVPKVNFQSLILSLKNDPTNRKKANLANFKFYIGILNTHKKFNKVDWRNITKIILQIRRS